MNRRGSAQNLDPATRSWNLTAQGGGQSVWVPKKIAPQVLAFARELDAQFADGNIDEELAKEQAKKQPITSVNDDKKVSVKIPSKQGSEISININVLQGSSLFKSSISSILIIS